MVPCMNSGIYRIDVGNGWFYIGQTANLIKRKSSHYRALKRKEHVNTIMQNCWNKYQVFEFTVLEKCDIPELLMREQLPTLKILIFVQSVLQILVL